MTNSENPKKACGSLKPSLHYAPMNVMPEVARVFELGARKYGFKNWRKQPIDVSTYYSAAMRHLNEFFENKVDADDESGQSPLAHVIACCMIVLDGLERGELIDDRDRAEVIKPLSETARDYLDSREDWVTPERKNVRVATLTRSVFGPENPTPWARPQTEELSDVQRAADSVCELSALAVLKEAAKKAEYVEKYGDADAIPGNRTINF